MRLLGARPPSSAGKLCGKLKQRSGTVCGKLKKMCDEVCGKVCGTLKKAVVETCVEICSSFGNLKSNKIFVRNIFHTVFTA